MKPLQFLKWDSKKVLRLLPSMDKFLIPLFSVLCPIVPHIKLYLCYEVWRLSGPVSPKRKPQSLAKGFGEEERLVAQLLKCLEAGTPTTPHTTIQLIILYSALHLMSSFWGFIVRSSEPFQGHSGQIMSILVSVILHQSANWVSSTQSQLSLFHLPLMSVKIFCLLLSFLQFFYCLWPKTF